MILGYARCSLNETRQDISSDNSRVKSYLKWSLLPLMKLYGKNSMPDVDNLLTSFYQLDDGARQDVIEMIKGLLRNHRDPDRANDIKNIKL